MEGRGGGQRAGPGGAGADDAEDGVGGEGAGRQSVFQERAGAVREDGRMYTVKSPWLGEVEQKGVESGSNLAFWWWW